MSENTKPDGGPAFPNVPDGAGDKWASWDEGMTLRDYFAAKALAPLVQNRVAGHVSYGNETEIAERAYELADAMIAARSKA